MPDPLVKQLKERHRSLKNALEDVDRRKAEFLSILLIARNKELWTYQEIASVLDISVSRVQQLVRQASGLKRSNR